MSGGWPGRMPGGCGAVAKGEVSGIKNSIIAARELEALTSWSLEACANDEPSKLVLRSEFSAPSD